MTDDGKGDFAATGRASDDEVLPASDRPRSALRTLRGDIAVAIVVLTVGGLIVRSLISGHATKPGVPTPTPTPIVTQATHSTELVIRPPCPKSGCRTVHAVPSAFVDAVRGVLPDIVVDRTVTQFVRANGLGTPDSIWSRTFVGHAASTRITIIVSAGVPTDSAAVQNQGASTVVTYVRLQQEPYTVQIRSVSFARIRPVLNQVVGLARDPRLVQRS